MIISTKLILLFLTYTILYTAAYSLVAFGGMFSERSGIINIGLEGIMVMGAISGISVACGLVSNGVDSKFLLIVIPLIVAGFVGLLYSLLLAFAAIRLKADQTITGTALNVLATALGIIFAKITNIKYSSNEQPQLSFPKLNDAFTITLKFGKAGNLRLNWFFIITLILLFLITIILYKTKFGLRLRSCGEFPQASASVGINVFKFRYIGVGISGLLGGIGGLAIIVPAISTWNFEQGVAGAGFLALSVMIFGQWKPNKIFYAAAFFGAFKALASISDTMFPALTKIGITDKVFAMIPFILSIVVLVFTSKKSRAPKAEGLPYDKGMR